MKYEKVNLSKQNCSILVFYCMDHRFQQAYNTVSTSLAGGYDFDLLVGAGASKAIVNEPSQLEAIKFGHQKHNVGELHILDHINCGAYGPVENEVEAHSHYLRLAAQKIAQAIPELKVVPHILGEEGELELPADLAA